MVWPRQKDARGENTKINYVLYTTGEKEKKMPKKNVDGRSTSSHDNKKFRTRSMEKQRGMAFGFRKKATVVKKSGQLGRYEYDSPFKTFSTMKIMFNPLKAELNPICHLLALLGAHHILHVSKIGVNSKK